MGLSRRLFTKEFKLAAVRRLEQGTSTSTNPAQVVRDNNPASAANGVLTDGTITLVANATCLLPETAPLPAP